jgi:hypothetical protein
MYSNVVFLKSIYKLGPCFELFHALNELEHLKKYVEKVNLQFFLTS